MAHLVDKEFVERANTMLLLGILWVGGVLLDFGGLTHGLEKTAKLAIDCASWHA